MSEENTNTEAETSSADTNPAMEKALAGGWRPVDEWEGNQEDWVDYREFNVRGELMGRIQEQSGILNNYKKQITEQQQALKDLADMQDKIAQREHDKIMRQLKAAKAEAIENSDGEQVNVIDDEIQKLTAQRKEEQVRARAKEKLQEKGEDAPPPEVQEWLANPRNSWYNTDEFLQGVANTIASQIVRNNPQASPREVLQQMEAQIRQQMPHKFSSTQTVDDGGGDSTNRSAHTGRSRKRTFKDLAPEEQAAAKRFEKLEVMSVEEYIAQLDAV